MVIASLDGGAGSDDRRGGATLAAILAGAADAVIAADLAGAVVYLNPAAERLTGWSAAEAAGRPLADVVRLLDEGTRERRPQLHALALEAQVVLSVPPGTVACAWDGRERPVRGEATPLRDSSAAVCGVALTLRDISAERRAENEAYEAQARYRRIIEATTEGVLLLDGRGRITLANPAAAAMLACAPRDLVGLALLDLMDEELREVYGPSGSRRDEWKLRRSDGGTVWALVSRTPIYGEPGGGTLALLSDITERKRADEVAARAARALRLLQACGRTLVRTTSEAELLDGICHLIVGTGDYHHCCVSELQGEGDQPLRVLAHAEVDGAGGVMPLAASDTDARAPTRRALLTGQPAVERDLIGDPAGTPCCARAVACGCTSVMALPLVLGGRPRAVLSIGAAEPAAFDEEEVALLGELAADLAYGMAALRERDERARAEARLRFSDRLASVGTLAAGVAHEINNPLSYVLAGLEYAISVLDGRGPRAPDQLTEACAALKDARTGAERVRTIVRDLKLFVRPQDEGCRPLDVRVVLESAVAIVRHELCHRARLRLELGAVPLVFANEARLAQVFLNLLVNAAQAIPEGAVAANEVRLVTRTAPDGRAVVEVHDTGCGIPPDQLGRIFDPFFTTKAAGAGTGLGLAICRDIVTELGGEVGVASEPGRGSAFRVSLPPAPASTEATAAARPVTAAGRRGRILVIDDDVGIARSLKRSLADEHDVVPVASARAALAVLDAGERFDVILCDLHMPEMSGMELYAALATTAPAAAARMVFTTGGAFTPNAREFLERVGNPRLDKPFDMDALRALLRERMG